MLGEMPLNCVICRARPSRGRTLVEGWACAGGDRVVERVEVSAGGGSWRTAELAADAVPGAWQLWRAELELAPGEHELVARARDSAGTTQPESAAALWNFKGYANNAWHRIRVRS
jgi:sulfite oxidase